MKRKVKENKVTTKIKRSELLSKLRCLGGSSWCKQEEFNVDLALEKVNTAIAYLLSYENLYGFSPETDYELKLTKRQIDLMFLFYTYINKGKFNDAYHELWDSIERLWVSYSTDDFLAYDELIAIYGLLFTFKQTVELSALKNVYQDTQKELKKSYESLDSLKYEYARVQSRVKYTPQEISYYMEKLLNLEIEKSYEEKIINSLSKGELKINELCLGERIGNKSYYISALRFARACENEEEYKQILELLQSDIKHLSDGILKARLMSVYNTYKDYNENLQS